MKWRARRGVQFQIFIKKYKNNIKKYKKGGNVDSI